MRLPVFLVGLCVVTGLSIGLGWVAGFQGWTMVLFVIGALVVAQLAYVAVVALLAREERAKRQAPSGARKADRAMPPQGQVSPKNDA